MLALALQAVAAFNLFCTGTEVHNPDLRTRTSSQRPFTEVIRVDLEARRWCSGDCRETFPIAQITNTQIVFASNTSDRAATDWVNVRVHRESGTYLSEMLLSDRISIRNGTCQRAPFTGFPRRRF
jgi:hypothetical protein